MSGRKKAKGGSVTDDMPSPSMLDGAALGATLDRIRVHCTTCDRPVATPREETTPRDQQNPAICYFNGGLACHKNEVDWRARCLAAEASLREEESLCTTEVLARLQAEDIAREALLEGLAEADRLRQALAVPVPPVGLLATRTSHIDALTALHDYGHRQPHVVGLEVALDEQAIRADAAREERERVVAWLKEAAKYVEQQLDIAMCKTCGSAVRAYEYKADAIRRAVLAIGDNAHAPGKGGDQ